MPVSFRAGAFGIAALAAITCYTAQPAFSQDVVDTASCTFPLVLNLRDGRETTSARLLSDVGQQQLVLVGIRLDSASQIGLANCMVEQAAPGRSPVLALQALPASAQCALDAWRVEDFSDPATFEGAIGWDTEEFGPFEEVAPLIDVAGALRAHVVATNLPIPGASDAPSADALLEVAPQYGLQTNDVLMLLKSDPISLRCPANPDALAEFGDRADLETYRIAAGRLIAGRGRGPFALFVGSREDVRADVAVTYLVSRTDRPPSMISVAAFTPAEWDVLSSNGLEVILPALAARYDYLVVAGDEPVDCQRE